MTDKQLQANARRIFVSYDDETDFMIISVTDGKEQNTDELTPYYAIQEGDYIELHDDKTDKIIGYQVLNYTKNVVNKKVFKMPWKNIDFLHDICPVIEKYFEEETTEDEE